MGPIPSLRASNRCLGWISEMLIHTSIFSLQKTRTAFSGSTAFYLNFDFQILDSTTELYRILEEKNKEKNTTARLVAGFCWDWSKTLDKDGCLIKDVKIGEFEMPWETHGDITKPPPGYVKWYEWAYKPDGIKQVGCIYTAQGFEFDYIGVIVGNDLVYDAKTDKLVGNISATKDPTLKKGKEHFDAYVKNIYRVLMTRGLKGCYVYFENKETEKYFRS